MTEKDNAIEFHTETDKDGEVDSVRIRFGPHYLVQVRKERDKTVFALEYTHHGFKADASQVSGELEAIIDQIRESHPQTRFD